MRYARASSREESRSVTRSRSRSGSESRRSKSYSRSPSASADEGENEKRESPAEQIKDGGDAVKEASPEKRSPSRESRSRKRSRSVIGEDKKEAPKEKRELSPNDHGLLSEFRRIRVACLSPNVTVKHLKEVFATFGNVVDIIMPVNHQQPHVSQCYGYLTYEKASEALEAVLKMHNGSIDGKFVSVTPAKERLFDRRRSPGRGRFGYNRRRRDSRSPIRRKSRSPPPRRSPPVRRKSSSRVDRRSVSGTPPLKKPITPDSRAARKRSETPPARPKRRSSSPSPVRRGRYSRSPPRRGPPPKRRISRSRSSSRTRHGYRRSRSPRGARRRRVSRSRS